jgi:hypothetical protein
LYQVVSLSESSYAITNFANLDKASSHFDALVKHADNPDKLIVAALYRPGDGCRRRWLRDQGEV